MARHEAPCPECGRAVSAREAGCPHCGHILDRTSSSGSGVAARSSRWPCLACAGCLALLVVSTAFVFVALQRGLSQVADDFQRLSIEGDLARIRQALERYADEHGGHYPAELETLLAAGQGARAFLDELPRDPWDRAYRYEPPPDGMRASGKGLLSTLGRDGERGGEGVDADLFERVASGR